ncbi:MAG: hypothetical protein QM224_02905 [Bacillota bacterium]|jgi:hypothetical protein|nr:hypothetical protein [Bacillota bacterium]
MSFIKKIFGSDKQDAANQTNISDSESAAAMHYPEAGTDEEVVAAIMAAIIAAMGPGASNGLRIRSIKRLGTNAPVWCVAGRQTYISSRL